jgi:hypothetical protein
MTPECEFVTLTVKLAPVPRTQRNPSAMPSRIPQAPLPFRVVRRSRVPAPLSERNEGDYKDGEENKS